MEATGKIIYVGEAREGVSQTTNQPWKIQEYVMQVEGRYPYKIHFSVSDGLNGRIQRLNLTLDKEYTIYFDIDASEYNGRWFTRITCFDAREKTAETQQEEVRPF